MAKKQTPTKPLNDDQDERYFQLIQRALAVCMNYRPKFGQGSKAGLTLDEFRSHYRGDPFYTWFGLDSPLQSTYSFAREVFGYDLAGFFTRNAARIRTEVEIVIEALLS